MTLLHFFDIRQFPHFVEELLLRGVEARHQRAASERIRFCRSSELNGWPFLPY